jgi:hypothetical protein
VTVVFAVRRDSPRPDASVDGSGVRDRRLIGRGGWSGNGRRRLRDRLRGGIRLRCGLRSRLWHRWLGHFRSVIHLDPSSKDMAPAVPTGADLKRQRHDDPSVAVRPCSPRTSSAVRAPSTARIGCRSRAWCCSPRGRTFDRPGTSEPDRVRFPARDRGSEAPDHVAAPSPRTSAPRWVRWRELPGVGSTQTSHGSFTRVDRLPSLGEAACRTTRASNRPR